MLDGKEEYMAVTQHEPTDCRRTMPCFDEPALKATFDVTLIVPSDYTALSNMPVKAEKPLEGSKKEVKFDTTPPMSTYLLAMVAYSGLYHESPQGLPSSLTYPDGKVQQIFFSNPDSAARHLQDSVWFVMRKGGTVSKF